MPPIFFKETKMKRTIYALCTVVCALFVMTSCSKSDDDKRFDIPEEAKAIIPEKFLAEMAANGMTINEGMNPPDIQGIFDAGNLQLVYSNLEKEQKTIGKLSSRYRFKFYDQQNIKVKTSYISDDDTASGQGSIISGSGNKFTAYLRVNGSTSLATYKMAIVISGEISSEGGKDFKLGICMIEKDDPKKNLMDIGTIRVWVDQDKFAPRKQKYPSGD